jgi:hypothetical protein
MVLFLLVDAHAFEVSLLFNNKELVSRELSREAHKDSLEWARHHSLGEELPKASLLVLRNTFNQLEKIDTTCDLGLIKELHQNALKLRVIEDSQELSWFINYLRSSSLIDDLLLRLMKSSLATWKEIETRKGYKLPVRPINLYTRLNSGIKLKDFFDPINKNPDDQQSCTVDAFITMVSKLSFKNREMRDLELHKLHYRGVREKIIDLETFNKLEALRKTNVLDWPIYLKRYADVINNAKDKLTKKPEAKSESTFPVEYVSKRERMTQRSFLFQNFTSTQVMMLAQIIQKTAKRMDAKQTSIQWDYNDPSGEREIYVLAPMEQYRAALKMLRKDMAEIMRSEAFKNTPLDYDHLIAAAYETGIVKSEDLDYVLKFEEFWNPKTPKWQAYARFAFSLAGTATFYFPPPWNVLGAIGLIFTQTKVLNGDQRPDADDNWNVII